MAGAALGGTRPVRMPKFAAKRPGRGGPSWDFVEGVAIATNEDDGNLILLEDFNDTNINAENHA